MERENLYRAAKQAAMQYREELVSRLGDVVVEEAEREWNVHYFWYWCTNRLVEHLQGCIFWEEFDPTLFAARDTMSSSRKSLVEEILDITAQMNTDGFQTFEEKNELTRKLANCVNRLLD